MHVRVRLIGYPDKVMVVESKLTKIDKFRILLRDKFGIEPEYQKLLYGGKLLENGYTFHDYSIKLNDVIQLMHCFSGDIKRDEPTAGSSKQAGGKVYKDTVCHLYSLGDLVDMRDKELGCWMEGKVTRIVYDPDDPLVQHSTVTSNDNNDPNTNDTKVPMDLLDAGGSSDGNDDMNIPGSESEDSTVTQSCYRVFTIKNSELDELGEEQSTEVHSTLDDMETESSLLYQIQLGNKEDRTYDYCKLNDIRPRARHEINGARLQPGDTVMINHNIDQPLEKGHWYDFKVGHIKKIRTIYELTGTLYLGPDGVPQDNTKVRIHDKIFAIEEVVPVAERSLAMKKMMITPTKPRSVPLNCLTCRDVTNRRCKDCGCHYCKGKEHPGKIVLCDECNKGFHMYCLKPVLNELPEGDWYCPDCKRDPNDVVAPGAAKQTKKISNTKRDWGRGMACIGKTKTCTMPANHFGPIPGVEVGMRWRFRIQLSEIGVHRPPVSGIHGRDTEGAYSIVLSGGYEDDVDYGNEFTYTGSGGRDLSGNKRTAEQSYDQKLTRENKALARNCAVDIISEEGGDAGDDWRNGKPVRVVRSYKMQKFFPEYAPLEGNRYDGIYKVVKYYPEKGLAGFRVWKYFLRRDDPNPAPWEDGATVYPIIYPDGYLEAEAEKLEHKRKNKGKGKSSKSDSTKSDSTKSDSTKSDSTKIDSTKSDSTKSDSTKKRALKENNQSSSDSDECPPVKKPRQDLKVSIMRLPTIFEHVSPSNMQVENTISVQESEAIKADTLNAKLWAACLLVCATRGKKEFIEHVTQEFLCIICRDVVVCPATTPCLHNFCTVCLKVALRLSGLQCPSCRNNLGKFKLTPNKHLTAALRAILPGYDFGKNNVS